MADRPTPQPDIPEEDVLGWSRTDTELAHERLRRAILRGDLAPGTRISQVQLARELGISRTPLREALRLLEREGLVESEPQRRVRVAPVSVSDVEQLYAMRIELEALAIRLSVPRMSESELRTLGEYLARMEEFARAEDYWRWEIPHRAFHRGLVAHAGDRLLRLVNQLNDHAERYRHAYTVRYPSAWSKGIAEHRAILDAVEARDPEAASDRLARHYSTVVLSLLAMIAPEHDPATVRTALRLVTRYEETNVEEGEPA